jgi:hypothetical protein
MKKATKLHGARERLRVCRERRARLSVKRKPRLHERNGPDQNEISLTVCDDLITIRGGHRPALDHRVLGAALPSTTCSSTFAGTLFTSLFPATSSAFFPATPN